jgi:hypothetical protein
MQQTGTSRYTAAFDALARHDRAGALTATVRGVLHDGVFHYRRSCAGLPRDARTTDVPAAAACPAPCRRCAGQPHQLLLALRRAGQAWNIAAYDETSPDLTCRLADHEAAIRIRRQHLTTVTGHPQTAALAGHLDRLCAQALDRTAARIAGPAHDQALRRAVTATVGADRAGACPDITVAVRANHTLAGAARTEGRILATTAIRTWLTRTSDGPDGVWLWGTTPAAMANLIGSHLPPRAWGHTPRSGLTTTDAALAFALWDPHDANLGTLDQAVAAASAVTTA